MDLVGWILTPFFLLSIALIVVMGILNHPTEIPPSAYSLQDSFIYGLTSGYNTMDLLGAFFFCSVVIQGLKKVSCSNGRACQQLLMKNALISSLVGALLLAGVYIGMSYVSSLHAKDLIGVRADMLLGTIALKVLGPYAGILTCFAVIMACLTTAIALASVFAEYLQTSVTKNALSYKRSLVFTLIITFLISTLEFNGIVQILAPCVQVLYPGLVILSLVNVAYKVWGFDRVKLPVVAAFALTMLFSL
jgi:LIVCS family branched-chain amino acid:cation transporter